MAAGNCCTAQCTARPEIRLLLPSGWETIRPSGEDKMRILGIVVLCAALGGCGAPRQEATTTSRPGDQLIGQNVDALIARFGQPTKSARMEGDLSSYVWELAAGPDAVDQPSQTPHGGLYGDGYNPGAVSQGFSPYCKINVIVSPTGTVTQVLTEDSNGTGARSGVFGSNGTICARRLGMRS